MKIDAIWSAAGLPVIGFIVGLYQKYVMGPVNQRLIVVEKETSENTKILKKIEGGQELIIEMLKKNGFKKR